MCDIVRPEQKGELLSSFAKLQARALKRNEHLALRAIDPFIVSSPSQL